MTTAILIGVGVLLLFTAALLWELHTAPELDENERPLTWEGDQA